MVDRASNVVRIAWGGLGAGTVIKGVPPEDLHPSGAGNLLPVTPSPDAMNVRMYDGLARSRPGYTTYATVPATSYPSPCNGLDSVQFKSGARYLVRFEPTATDPGGTHTGAGPTDAVLVDSTRSWVADSLIGSTVTNTTSVQSAVITDNDATTITAAVTGGWDAADAYTISGDTGRAYRLDDSTNPFSWIDITGTNIFTGSLQNWWTATMSPIAGTAPLDEKYFFCNGKDDIYAWTGTGNIAAPSWTGTAPTAVRVLISYLSRLFAMNFENGSGDRLQNSIQYSIVGDSTDWSSLGAGTVNLTQDQYPIVNALVLGGRLCIFKGDVVGGSIVVGTPTGIATNPVRYDTVQTGVGIIVPQSVVQIGESLCFFFGHDGFYLYDGARTMRPFAQDIARSIVADMNMSGTARDSGFAVYHPIRREILFGYASRGSTKPNVFWWIDPFGQRVYGPHEFTDEVITGEFHIPFGGLTWDTLDGRSTGRTWQTLQNSAGNPFGTWDAIIDESGATGYQLVFGLNDGVSPADNGEVFKDGGVSYTSTWRSPAITPAGFSIAGQGGESMVDPEAVMTLRGITVRFQDLVAWIPIVEVSTDGASTWTTISDGLQVGSGSSKILSKTYRDLRPSDWFQFRISNSGEQMGLHSIVLEFTTSGSFRNT